MRQSSPTELPIGQNLDHGTKQDFSQWIGAQRRNLVQRIAGAHPEMSALPESSLTALEDAIEGQWREDGHGGRFDDRRTFDIALAAQADISYPGVTDKDSIIVDWNEVSYPRYAQAILDIRNMFSTNGAFDKAKFIAWTATQTLQLSAPSTSETAILGFKNTLYLMTRVDLISPEDLHAINNRVGAAISQWDIQNNTVLKSEKKVNEEEIASIDKLCERMRRFSTDSLVSGSNIQSVMYKVIRNENSNDIGRLIKNENLRERLQAISAIS